VRRGGGEDQTRRRPLAKDHDNLTRDFLLCCWFVGLQKFYSDLQAIALNQDKPEWDEAKDDRLQPDEEGHEAAADQVQMLKAALDIEGLDLEEAVQAAKARNPCNAVSSAKQSNSPPFFWIFLPSPRNAQQAEIRPHRRLRRQELLPTTEKLRIFERSWLRERYVEWIVQICLRSGC
jgi:hypothetical protein